LSFLHHHQLVIEPSRLALALAPKSRQTVRITLRALQPLPVGELDLLDLLWSVTVARDDLRDLPLRGTRTVDWEGKSEKR
jgi:hypothetical protein